MKKLLDNGTLVTLGLVAAVAAVGAANKAGLYGSRALDAAGRRPSVTRYRLTDTYDPHGDLFTFAEVKKNLRTLGETRAIRVLPDGRIVFAGGGDEVIGRAVAAVGAANQAGFYGPSTGSAARGLSFGWAQVKGGHVVKVSNAERKPTGTGWGEINTVNTKIGDRAHLDGGMVYLKGGSLNEGSAARGVTEGYVESYLDGDNIAISSVLNRHLRGKAKQYAGSYARRMKAALEAMVASGEAVRDTTPNGAASYRRADHAPSGSAARSEVSPLRVGDRVRVRLKRAGRAGGLPRSEGGGHVGTIQEIDAEGFCDIRFDDGEQGYYRLHELTRASTGSAARGLRTLPFTFVNATAEESKGMFHPPQVIRIGKKRIVTPAGSGDDVDAYVYGDNVLVVVSNSRMPYYGATLYTDDEQGGYRVDQDVFLQGQEEVVDALGKRYDSLRDLTIANKLLAALS